MLTPFCVLKQCIIPPRRASFKEGTFWINKSEIPVTTTTNSDSGLRTCRWLGGEEKKSISGLCDNTEMYCMLKFFNTFLSLYVRFSNTSVICNTEGQVSSLRDVIALGCVRRGGGGKILPWLCSDSAFVIAQPFMLPPFMLLHCGHGLSFFNVIHKILLRFLHTLKHCKSGTRYFLDKAQLSSSADPSSILYRKDCVSKS